MSSPTLIFFKVILLTDGDIASFMAAHIASYHHIQTFPALYTVCVCVYILFANHNRLFDLCRIKAKQRDVMIDG